MIETVSWEASEGGDTLAGALVRYAILGRLSRILERHGVTVLAFGMAEREIRLLVDGEPNAIAHGVRALKIASSRSAAGWGLSLSWTPATRTVVHPAFLEAAAGWVHRAPVDAGAAGPLASPWSSHRDLMGYRKADFYDPAALAARVDRVRVHGLAGGRGLPSGWPPSAPAREPLELLLRLAAAVLGVLPADRRCFRLFVHLGRARGWRSGDLAQALAMSSRRVRQLAAQAEEHLPVALVSLADAQLCRVP